jgi:holo-[acyl-carrier protein] synthase
MIVGVGIDIIEVERVAEKMAKDNGFREKVFSKMEIQFCESKGKNKAQHYAARFAAKESFLKATGKGLQLTHELNEIEIVCNNEGKPTINLLGHLASVVAEKKWNVHLSLAHVQSTACATVIIESTEPATM